MQNVIDRLTITTFRHTGMPLSLAGLRLNIITSVCGGTNVTRQCQELCCRDPLQSVECYSMTVPLDPGSPSGHLTNHSTRSKSKHLWKNITPVKKWNTCEIKTKYNHFLTLVAPLGPLLSTPRPANYNTCVTVHGRSYAKWCSRGPYAHKAIRHT